MNYELLFTISNIVIMPFWFLMIVLPRWKWTQRIIGSPLIALPLALIYALLVLPQLGSVLLSLSNPTISAIAELLGTPAGVTIGWAHFLAFDLLVGRWAYFDGQVRHIHPLLMAVSLFFILMLGPVGFLLHLIVRWIYEVRGGTVPQNHQAVA
jgi:hypothetical protein